MSYLVPSVYVMHVQSLVIHLEDGAKKLISTFQVKHQVKHHCERDVLSKIFLKTWKKM